MERGIWQAMVHMGFPGDSVVKNMPVNAGDTGYMGLIFRWGRFPEEEMAAHSIFLPEKSLVGSWRTTVHGVARV